MRDELILTYQVLDDNNYDYNGKVVEDIISKSKSAKADLIALLRKMPGWNEEAQAVIFDRDIIRSIDVNSCNSVFNWMQSKLLDSIPEEKRFVSYNECRDICNRLDQKLTAYRRLIDLGENGLNNRVEELVHEKIKFMDVNDWYSTNTMLVGRKRISLENEKKYRAFCDACDFLRNVLCNNESTLSEEVAISLGKLYPDLKFAKGQKVSKAFGKICKANGLDKIKQIEVDYNGREKDYGYNYQFAKFGDSCNPFHVPRYVILSINFVDFLYMSNGNSWGSCHTIIDGGAWGYRGEYSSGTISYALDPCSMIFYTVDKEYNGDEFCLQSKQQRAVFAYNKGVLYEGRVYPDGRDGGDQGYAVQFRSIVQKLFADVEGKANLWTKVSGDNKQGYINTLGGTAYADWYHYSDTNITTLNEIETSGVTVIINAKPICIECGYTHDCCDNINCCDSDMCTCPECGERFHEDDGVWAGDEHFCCDDCAERAGYHWCEDAYEYVYEDYCHQDDYTGEWFREDCDMVETEDGHTYRNYETAENAGYRETDDGYWYPEDEVYYDAYNGKHFHAENSDEVFEFNGNYYSSLENAEADGQDVSEYKEEVGA